MFNNIFLNQIRYNLGDRSLDHEDQRKYTEHIADRNKKNDLNLSIPPECAPTSNDVVFIRIA